MSGRNAACAVTTVSRAPARSSSAASRRSFSARPASVTDQPELPPKLVLATQPVASKSSSASSTAASSRR
ncbi:MAG TPA: hypothetical protein VF053_06115 [Streptosporangiales bacterium]